LSDEMARNIWLDFLTSYAVKPKTEVVSWGS
jgi:hypothetical protein